MGDIYGQGVIPDDWIMGEYCQYSVCWPNSVKWLAVLRGVLTLPARGRFWDEKTGIVTLAQATIRETFNKNLHLEECIMACNDGSLNQIAEAIRFLALNKCCGGTVPTNGGIQVIITTPLGVQQPIYGTQPPNDLGIGQVPPDYPGTLAEYQADRCRTASGIVDGIVATLRAWSHITFTQTTGLVLIILAAVAGLIIIPEFTIPILIAAAIATVGVNAGMVAMANAIEADKANWVCWMMTNQNAETILGYLSDAIDAIIAAIPATGILAISLKTIAMVIINADTINQLNTLTQGQGAAYDCSGCGRWTNFTNGAITQVDTDEWLLEADNVNCDDMDYTVSAYFDDVAFMTIEVESGALQWAGSTQPSCGYIYRAFYCEAAAIRENENTPPTYPFKNSGFTIRSQVPFTLRVIIDSYNQDC